MASLSRTAHERTKEPSDACEQTPVRFRHVCSSGRDGREQRHTGGFQPERRVFIAERNPTAFWRKESLALCLVLLCPRDRQIQGRHDGREGKGHPQDSEPWNGHLTSIVPFMKG